MEKVRGGGGEFSQRGQMISTAGEGTGDEELMDKFGVKDKNLEGRTVVEMAGVKIYH